MHIEDQISYEIRKYIFKVYNATGPGLLESMYEEILACEFKLNSISFKRQVPLPIIYKDLKLEGGYRVDFIVEDKVIIELKSVENLAEVHHKQVITYLKLSELKLGLLVNFNCDDISKNIFRKVNGL